MNVPNSLRGFSIRLTRPPLGTSQLIIKNLYLTISGWLEVHGYQKKKKQNSKPISSQCGWLYEMCKYFTQAPNHL